MTTVPSSAAIQVPWQVGWVVGGTSYAILQTALGFEGYTVNFVTIITLYTIATGPYWFRFGRTDVRTRPGTQSAQDVASPSRAVRR